MAIKTFIRLIIEDGDLQMKTRLINDINLLIVCAATGAAVLQELHIVWSRYR